MKEFLTAVEDVVAEDAGEQPEDSYIEFKFDGRVMRAYRPNETQLMFLMAALGRGQKQESRFASIINLMLATFREEDALYLEDRMLTSDPRRRVKPEQIEEIFEYLSEEWFARPTQSPSDSAQSPQSGGQN